jgi:hypothetical protein
MHASILPRRTCAGSPSHAESLSRKSPTSHIGISQVRVSDRHRCLRDGSPLMAADTRSSSKGILNTSRSPSTRASTACSSARPRGGIPHLTGRDVLPAMQPALVRRLRRIACREGLVGTEFRLETVGLGFEKRDVVDAADSIGQFDAPPADPDLLPNAKAAAPRAVAFVADGRFDHPVDADPGPPRAVGRDLDELAHVVAVRARPNGDPLADQRQTLRTSHPEPLRNRETMARTPLART